MPPAVESAVLIEEELQQARSWLEHKGIKVDWKPADLRVRTVIEQPQTNERFYLQGIFKDYKEMPPVWEFFDENWEESAAKRLYPARKPCPFGSSIFHTDPFLCVHFNRKAYAEEGGRHDDWGGPANWRNVKNDGQAHATEVGQMLQHICRHLWASRGRMG